jgi:hypothetical protein
MTSDLSERYNDGIVPPPDLPNDIPRLRQPGRQATPSQTKFYKRLPTWVIIAIVVSAAMALGCLSLLATVALFVRGL